MCTALSFKTKDHYFGRSLDLDFSYGEVVCIMPRNYPLFFRKKGKLNNHYALIGMATIINNIPLFYEASNEFGLAMAGLNFPNNAYYYQERNDKDNITPFEFIPWILGKCKNIKEVKELLGDINIVNIPFSDKLPLSPLHWIIADNEEAIVVECMKDKMYVYENKVGVLTNNPPFPYQLKNLNNYQNLKNTNNENYFDDNLKLSHFCQGLGAMGLPGDVSSMSRFVRVTFNKLNSVCESDEKSSISQFFHILNSVEMVKGSCKVHDNNYDITIYSSCINTSKGLYYYTTYNNHQINCVSMFNTDLDSKEISCFPLVNEEHINYHN